jgi:hypothetical protein
MEHIKRVAADEFAEHAAAYLAGEEAVLVEKDGEVIGRYVPERNGHAASDASAVPDASGSVNLRRLEEGIDPESMAIIRQLDQLLEKVYEEAGMTEEEFASYFDMTKPSPKGGSSAS